MGKYSIDQLFVSVQAVIFHLSDNEGLRQTMSAYGVDQARITEGSTLLQNARQLHTTQADHYNVARRLSSQLKDDCTLALDTFRGHVTIAKSAFRKDMLTLKELKITSISNSRWDWIMQAIHFYEKAPQHIDKLIQFGATSEDFMQNKAAVEALLVLKDRRMQKKGEAEDSTQQKNEAVKALREWYGEFRKLARIAFKKNPQVLETFGMVVS